MSMTARALCEFLVAVCLSLSLALAALAQTAVPSPLPPAAQEAVNKGILAAKVPDYLLAIRHFEEARKLAPEAPVIYLNLGLAESKIPGRELRSIAWFGAYLAADPKASNAAAVNEQIDVLQIRIQNDISRLIRSLQKVAVQNANLRDVAGLWAEAGDITEARHTAQSALTADWKRAAQSAIADAQIRAGDTIGAQKTLAIALETADLIVGDEESKSIGQNLIAEAQIRTGDIAGAKKTLATALKTADLIKNENYKSYVQRTIAISQIKAGDAAGAQLTLASAQRTADLIADAKDRTYAQTETAEAQVDAGYIAEARQALASALKSAAFIRDEYWKVDAPGRIAHVQIKAGDIAGAQKTADSIQRADLKFLIQSRITQAKGGITNAPNLVRQSIPDAQSSVPPVIAASDWMARLDDGNRSNDCPLNTEPFLDLAGHLKSLPPTDNPRNYFDSAGAVAVKLVRARNCVAGMLKQQAKR